MLKILLLTISLFAAAAHAATPQQMTLVYDLYRNGHKLGQVTDVFSRDGSRYTLSSETRASGSLKLLWPGRIHLESTGEVTHEGLRPGQFQHARSDAPQKLASARLDWKQRTIAWQYKGASWQENGLQNGAQDQLSQRYQFMFMPSLPADISLQVVGGRDRHDYRYVRSEGEMMQTPLGELATQQYQRVTQQPDEKAVTVWIAPARGNLPLQIRVSEDGVTLEQRLVRASVRD